MLNILSIGIALSTRFIYATRAAVLLTQSSSSLDSNNISVEETQNKILETLRAGLKGSSHCNK